jgi:hypothetical protein
MKRNILILLIVVFAAFHSEAHVSLLYPSGGETFYPGDTVIIEWQEVISHNTLNWDIYFSSDGGLTWEGLQIDISVDLLSHQWIVPETLTTLGKIKIVQDNVDTDYEDICDNFTILSSSSNNAYAWAPVGATWYYTERHAFSGDQTFLKITSVKDTVVFDKNCRLIQKQGNPMCSGRPNIELMYQKDSVVYFWDDEFNRFQILYDLTKRIREFWIIEVYDNRYDWELDSFIINADTIRITVNSISSIEINGKLLKQLHVTYDVITEVYPYSYNSIIIEKIGDVNYLFNYYPYSSMACDGNFANGLRCYEDSELGFYSTGIADSCNYIYKWVSIQEFYSDSYQAVIYPNPFTDQLTIEGLPNDDLLIEIYDLFGRAVYLDTRPSDNSITISTADIKAGLYLLRVRDTDSSQTITSKKIVKQ